MKTTRILTALFLAIPTFAIAQSSLDNDSRVCTTESGLTVCRNIAIEEKPQPVHLDASPDQARGRLLVLLDIPADIFSRLAASPESNRKYHPKRSWQYHPAAPAPAGADKYRPAPDRESLWRYKPKSSFAYTPRRDWTYDRDVFGRLWRANIAHDTRVIEVPIMEPFEVYLPVGEVR